VTGVISPINYDEEPISQYFSMYKKILSPTIVGRDFE